MNDIHNKLGDVLLEDIRKSVYKLVKEGVLKHTSYKTFRKYWLA